ncbi:MAG: S8/S53 family peptidase [Chloroflexota bacterium]|nr:S8/S53 family peptidase [Chloroflexota bacterium]
MQPPYDPDESELVNHAPDELCIDVSTTPAAAADQVYDQVQSALNEALVRAHLVGLEGARFESLARSGLSRDAKRHASRPWIEATLADTPERSNWHLFYQLGPGRADFSPGQTAPRRRREERLREFINALNSGALGTIAAPDGDTWRVAGASPNWLTAALPFSCGSPASLPVGDSGPTDGRWRFHFGERLQAELDRPPSDRPARVVVAVLDTCPMGDKSQFERHGNRYLAEVLDQLTILDTDADPAMPADYFRPPADAPLDWNACLPRWQENMLRAPAPQAEFAMPDHGLFVSGIVHDIAADADLYLLRVLNEFGVGDLVALEKVLRGLPEFLLRNASAPTRIIINLSLGAAVPVPRQRYFLRWFPDLAGGRWAWPDETSNLLLEGAHRGLANTMRWLRDQGVLVVAAAGNDAQRPHIGPEPPPPRYPAYYESVFAVAAAQADAHPAPYSNKGDVEPLGNGITTFGGNVLDNDARERPPLPDPRASVVGVYSTSVLPGSTRPNASGWVRWSGTSFAAPIIAGVAARLWQQDARQTPEQLIERLRACARSIPGQRGRTGDPDGPLDAPYLQAWQEFEAYA